MKQITVEIPDDMPMERVKRALDDAGLRLVSRPVQTNANVVPFPTRRRPVIGTVPPGGAA